MLPELRYTYKDKNEKKKMELMISRVYDISCLIDARLQGRQPIAITNKADTIDLALTNSVNRF
jgi:hypothetical protein